jgi:phospholipid/cholesterol/gamma-HCH transport system substrate-binding protein
MLQSLAKLGDVGTRVIDQAGANTVEDLKSLQPILSQLAAAGPDLANSLDLVLTYPFPASSLSALHTRKDQRTGGYAMFTNMTATLNLDLAKLLCQYVVDPTTGALRVVDLADPVAQACTAAAATASGSGGATSAPSGSGTAQAFSLPTLPGLTGVVPDPPRTTDGLLGLPDLPLASGSTP